jgi:septum formation protein
MRILLGSKSPRRNELLKQMGVEFSPVSIHSDEAFSSEMEVKEVASYLAKEKSLAYSQLEINEILITADTVVIAEGEILNKPKNEDEARAMLQKMSNKSHEVVTGVALRTKEKFVVFDECTTVHVDPLSKPEIDHYISKYLPFDKAGSYGIQEWFGLCKISGINGCFYNVVGLPCNALYKRLIDDFNVEI